MAASLVSTALSSIRTSGLGIICRAAAFAVQRPVSVANYSVACGRLNLLQHAVSFGKPGQLTIEQPSLQIAPLINAVPSRTVTKWSLSKGKRKSVKAVVRRFYRLEWGAWIRTLAGRNKKKWRKTGKRLNRGKKHLFVNATQSTLLDKMVTKFWRRRRFYIEDPYEPYHSREEFPISARKPH